MLDLDQLTALASSTLKRFHLNGKVAIVVGGSRGLGQAMALALSAAGADVCVVGRNEGDLKKSMRPFKNSEVKANMSLPMLPGNQRLRGW